MKLTNAQLRSGGSIVFFTVLGLWFVWTGVLIWQWSSHYYKQNQKKQTVQVSWQINQESEEIEKPPFENLGQVGDSYNFITSIVGLLTLAGLIYTINIQRSERQESKFQDHFFKLSDYLREYNTPQFIEATDDFIKEADYCFNGDVYKIINKDFDIIRKKFTEICNDGMPSEVLGFTNLLAATMWYLDDEEVENPEFYRVVLNSCITKEQFKCILVRACVDDEIRGPYARLLRKHDLQFKAFASEVKWDELQKRVFQP